MKSFRTFITEALLDVDKRDIDRLYAPLKRPLSALRAAWDNYDAEYPSGTQAGFREALMTYRPKLQYAPLKTFSSAELDSPLCKKAHELNPITIKIYLVAPMGNLYSPTQREIQIGIPDGTMRSMVDSLGNVPSSLIPSLKNEVDEIKVKATIRHEITHWLDDSLHGKYIGKLITTHTQLNRDNPKAANKYFYKVVTHGKGDIYMAPLEITAMVNQIAEVKRRVGEKKYDKMTWADVMLAVPALGSLNEKHGAKWRQIMFTRLAREGLVGKNFRQKLA